MSATTTYRQDGELILAGDENGEWIFGKLTQENGETWIGCVTCGQEIVALDAGMCRSCREDTAFRDEG